MSNESDGARRIYLQSKRGDLTAYAGMIGEEFSTKLDRLSQIIGTAHEPSIGRYKESLLRNCIELFIPKRYSVDSGFVAFMKESPARESAEDNLCLLNLKEHYVSQQIDLIVYDDYNYPPLFRDSEFVVVRPESVRSIVEVKGYLARNQVADALKGFLDFGRKWAAYSQYCARWGRQELHEPSIHLMGFRRYVDKKGRISCSGSELRNQIVAFYKKEMNADEIMKNKIPRLSAAYAYEDYVVAKCTLVDNGLFDGYHTTRGRFARYDDNMEPYLDRDSTISSLLASVYISLETPFNPDFSYFDQGSVTDPIPHEDAGFTMLRELEGAKDT